MLLNGRPAVVDEDNWTVERIFTGERLYCTLQTEMVEAIEMAVTQVAEVGKLLSKHEVAGIIAHSLIETAMRQVMASKMPVTLAQWEGAARLVYLSCHQQEGDGDDDPRH